VFDCASSLSDLNKCAIHTSFSSNENWGYDWYGYCAPNITGIEDTSMAEDSELMLQLSAEAFDDYDIYFEVNSDTSSVFLYLEGDMLHITPEPDWNGTAEITIMAYSNSDSVLSDTASFTITVYPVNDAPFFSGPMHALAGAGIEFHIPIHVSDIDMDGNMKLYPGTR
jgi:hypothetical protein